MEDKRRHVRLPKEFRVEAGEFKFPLARQPKFELPCVDISAGGMRIETDRKFNVGDKLQVKIFIPSLNKYHPGFFKVFESDAGQYLQVIAEVVRVEEILPMSRYELGLRYLDVDLDDRKALHSFIRKAVERGS
jgi:c-di-GMP-binding flagellar brake protein YcgR